MGRKMLRYAVDDANVMYCQPSGLARRFSIGRTTVYNLLQKMRENPNYRNSFLDLNHQLKLVKLEDFERFLQEQNRMYLKR